MSEEPFDPDTEALVKRALDEAWRDLRTMLIVEPLDGDGMRGKVARRISAAARKGERDVRQLKLIGLGIS